ncbi:MAG: AI-2E family transporter [Bacteroidales bacterium]
MNQSTGNIQRIAYSMIIIALLIYLLIIGKFIIVPMIFAALLSIMIQPICNFLERYVHAKIPVIILSFIIVLIPVGGIITFFSYQMGDVLQNMPAIADKLQHSSDLLFTYLNDNLGISRADIWDWFRANFSKVLDSPIQFFKGGLISGTAFLVNFFMVLIFMFFMLLYRGAIKNFLLLQFKDKRREQGVEILVQIQRLVRHYLYGLLTVILILAFLNSIGLWIIGVGYPVFWASLAAFLSIIPYIGTTLGGLLPFMYAIATLNTWWQPLAVVALYSSIQQLEGNLITPYVVGSNVKINPFIAILSLLIGGYIWGLSGIVLGIPLAAIVKLIFDNVDSLKPVGVLMSNNLHKQDEKLLEDWDEDRYRISSLFKDKNEE